MVILLTPLHFHLSSWFNEKIKIFHSMCLSRHQPRLSKRKLWVMSFTLFSSFYRFLLFYIFSNEPTSETAEHQPGARSLEESERKKISFSYFLWFSISFKFRNDLKTDEMENLLKFLVLFYEWVFYEKIFEGEKLLHFFKGLPSKFLSSTWKPFIFFITLKNFKIL